ncbi:hypothetical protein JR338_12735 (plasmid) [Chloroflexota bacterium]|nr:hypothetical protein JR338_12735 [Chloroflexota bacterium]
MQNIIKRFGNSRVVLMLLVLVLFNVALFSIPALAGSRPRILALAPNYSVPDMKGIYTPDYVYDFLTAIGPAGRQAYQMMHFTTDLAFPFLYGLLLFAGLSLLVTQNSGESRPFPLIAFLPFVSDLAENFIMVAITASYPKFKPGLIWLAQGFTLLKFGGITFCVVVIVFLSIKHRKTG